MNLKFIISLGLIAVVGAHQALAQEGKTRAEVRAELEQATRTGDIIDPGESGLPLNQLHPERYPARPMGAGKSREQVKAETREAIRDGELPLQGEFAHDPNDIQRLNRGASMAGGKTREQVKAELADAIRTGDILVGGELSLRRNQLYPWTYSDKSPVLAGRGPVRSVRRPGPIGMSSDGQDPNGSGRATR